MLLFYYNLFYDFINVNINLPHLLGNILAMIMLIPWSLFYLMTLTFTILIHPTVFLIIIIGNIIKNKKFIENCIYFSLSTLMALMYIYIIWGKGYILTV
jgi:hypothetical protein